MAKNEPKANHAILAVVAIITLAAIIFFVTPKNDSESRLSNAAEEIGEGVNDAADELRGERSTGEKIGDAVEDVGNDIKDAAQ